MTAHWICSTTLERKKIALTCKRLPGRHFNDILAVHMKATTDDFKITEKVSDTVTDGAENFKAAFR